MSDIQKKVIHIIADLLSLPASEINLELMFGDLPEWDSLKHVAIITQVENSFDLLFDVDQITELESVEDIVDLVEECLPDAVG
jgi:acyl carrier protein